MTTGSNMEGYTNVCEATSQSLDLNSYRPTHRKGKKLLAEKKRRARINNCLMQIRDIVCNEEEAKDNDIDKMEKAEILEKTLEVLTKLRSDCSGSYSSMSSHKAMAVRYASGFSSCAEESIRYIQCSRLIPSEVKNQLQAHLRSIARRMESKFSDSSSAYNEYVYPASVSSLPTLQIQAQEPNTSNLLLPLSSNTPTAMHISPSKQLDFQDTPQRISPQASSDFRTVSPEPKINALSPIHTSTPVLQVEDREMVVHVTCVPHDYQNSHTNFIPISAHDFAQEYKENHPGDNSHYSTSTSYSQDQERIAFSQGSSAFHKLTPHSLTSSSPKDFQSAHAHHHISSSSLPKISSAELPIVSHSRYSPTNDSQYYSPISPASSPVPMASVSHQSHATPSPPKQHIYQYHGYEPYPIRPVTPSHSSEVPAPSSSLNLSQSTPTTTPSSALDLCIKRNESHNISPETMWRPW